MKINKMVVIILAMSMATGMLTVDAYAGLVSWWRAEGDSRDSAGGANGSLEGVSFAPGIVGQAL